jgi:hypothetical protein
MRRQIWQAMERVFISLLQRGDMRFVRRSATRST